ncbi:hypothetical protein BLNAU_24814 [Blattamonas nauphoetae]|uniref:Uncharacterized protein n=1 Tax=Blattamonas nauphoetae TaxID=2049346 RepID=A0ABQ9WLT4_9EUKA|nr:hypothetical protein BLNAU_24814 [Blattamonas nauphoetae]
MDEHNGQNVNCVESVDLTFSIGSMIMISAIGDWAVADACVFHFVFDAEEFSGFAVEVAGEVLAFGQRLDVAAFGVETDFDVVAAEQEEPKEELAEDDNEPFQSPFLTDENLDRMEGTDAIVVEEEEGEEKKEEVEEGEKGLKTDGGEPEAKEDEEAAAQPDETEQNQEPPSSQITHESSHPSIKHTLSSLIRTNTPHHTHCPSNYNTQSSPDFESEWHSYSHVGYLVSVIVFLGGWMEKERKGGKENDFLSSIRKDMKTRSLKQVTLNPTRIVDNAKSELIEKMASRPQNFLTHSEYIELLRTITPHLVILRRDSSDDSSQNIVEHVIQPNQKQPRPLSPADKIPSTSSDDYTISQISLTPQYTSLHHQPALHTTPLPSAHRLTEFLTPSERNDERTRPRFCAEEDRREQSSRSTSTPTRPSRLSFVLDDENANTPYEKRKERNKTSKGDNEQSWKNRVWRRPERWTGGQESTLSELNNEDSSHDELLFEQYTTFNDDRPSDVAITTHFEAAQSTPHTSTNSEHTPSAPHTPPQRDTFGEQHFQPIEKNDAAASYVPTRAGRSYNERMVEMEGAESAEREERTKMNKHESLDSLTSEEGSTTIQVGETAEEEQDEESEVDEEKQSVVVASESKKAGREEKRTERELMSLNTFDTSLDLSETVAES